MPGVRRTHPALWLLGLLWGCGDASAPVTTRNNGHNAQLSMWTGGLPAEGHVFAAQLYRLDQDGVEQPITVEEAHCLDPVVCQLLDQPALALDGRAVLTVAANRAGVTSVVVRARTADGVVVEDQFCVRVARPTALEVSCEGCVDGQLPAQDGTPGGARVTCQLFNRGVSDRPLLGFCDASPTSTGLRVARHTPVQLPAVMEDQVAPGTTRGERFDVQAVGNVAGQTLWLHHGGLRVALPSR